MALDPWLVVAVSLLVAGVLAPLVPPVPGPVLSTGGVLLYWWSTGYAVPSPPVVVGLSAVGVFAAAVDLLAGALGARAGGASTLAAVLGAVVGTGLLFVVGPAGLLVGVAGTVLFVEVYRGASLREGLRAAAVAVVSALAAGVVQALLALSMLVAFLFVVVGG